MPEKQEKYNLGIVLSGGAARGYSHAGILKALEDKGMGPDVISGVSAGSIVGAMYANGMSTEDMFEFFTGQEGIFSIVRVGFPRKGLFKVSGLRKKLRKIFGYKKIEELEKKLIITATNINKPGIEYFETGEIVPRVLASSAIPVLFNPVEINGQTYVDGGILDNFPVEPIRGLCMKVVGVSLNPIKEEKSFKNLWTIAERTFKINVSSKTHAKLNKCDLVIEPEELEEYSYYKTAKGREMFEIGYNTALKALQHWDNSGFGTLK